MKKPPAGQPPSPFRILLIGDNRNGRTARKSLLEEQGYEVVACASPEEGLEHLAAADFQLIVTEYRMRKMNGAEFIAQVREARPAMPVVLVSGLVEVLGLTEASTGANVVVAKNSTEVPNLLHAIDRILCPKPVRKAPRRQSSIALKRAGTA